MKHLTKSNSGTQRVVLILFVFFLHSLGIYGQNRKDIQVKYLCDCKCSSKSYISLLRYKKTILNNLTYDKIYIINHKLESSYFYLIRQSNDSVFFNQHCSENEPPDTNIKDIYIGSFIKKKFIDTLSFNKVRLKLIVSNNFRRNYKHKMGVEFYFMSFPSHIPFFVGLIVNKNLKILQYEYNNGQVSFICKPRNWRKVL